MVVFSRNSVHSVLFLIFAFFNAAGLFLLMGAELLAMLLVIVYVGAVAVLFLFVVMLLDVNPMRMRSFIARNRLKSAFIQLMKFLRYLMVFTAVLFVAVYLFSYTGHWALKFMHIQDDFLIYNHSPQLLSDLFRGILPHVTWKLLVALSIFALGLFLARYYARRITQILFMDTVSEVMASPPILLAISVLLLTGLMQVMKKWQSSPAALNLRLNAMPKAPITNTEVIGNVLYTDYFLIFQLSGLVLLIAMIGAIVLTLRKREVVKRQDINKQLLRTKENSLEIRKIPIGKGI